MRSRPARPRIRSAPEVPISTSPPAVPSSVIGSHGCAAGCAGGSAAVTVTGAVGPVRSMTKPDAVAPASFMYTPGAPATVTPNWREMLPLAGTWASDPSRASQVSVCPAIDGFELTAPEVDPGTYEKPAGSVSVIVSRPTATSFGFDTVIVYPLLPPATVVGASAVFDTTGGGSAAPLWQPPGLLVPSTRLSRNTAESWIMSP